MDLNALVATVHQSPAAMFAVGVAVSNRLLLLHYAVLGILKVPLLRRIALGNPDQVLATIDAFRKEVKDDLEEAAKAESAKANAVPLPNAPPSGPIAGQGAQP